MRPSLPGTFLLPAPRTQAGRQAQHWPREASAPARGPSRAPALHVSGSCVKLQNTCPQGWLTWHTCLTEAWGTGSRSPFGSSSCPASGDTPFSGPKPGIGVIPEKSLSHPRTLKALGQTEGHRAPPSTGSRSTAQNHIKTDRWWWGRQGTEARTLLPGIKALVIAAGDSTSWPGLHHGTQAQLRGTQG